MLATSGLDSEVKLWTPSDDVFLEGRFQHNFLWVQLNFKDDDRVAETKEQMMENINSASATRRARFSFLDRLRLLEYMVVLKHERISFDSFFRRDESELQMTVLTMTKILTTTKKRVTEVVARCNSLITSSLYSFHSSPYREAFCSIKVQYDIWFLSFYFLDIESVWNGIFTVYFNKSMKWLAWIWLDAVSVPI